MTPKRKEPDMSTYSGRLAARLRYLRERAGLSVKQTVKQINARGYPITEIAYYAWEIGTRQVNLNAIPALAATFGLKTCQGLFPKQ
jgi:transcriptional regulator with XRE-family HTH domain